MGDLFSEEDEDMGYTLNEGETANSNYYTPLFEILSLLAVLSLLGVCNFIGTFH